jgi:hypothetical protein
MVADESGTVRHWIVAIAAAAIVLGGLLMFGGRPPEPAPVTPAEQPAQ